MVKIKICGLKTAEEIEIVNQFDVSYAGFIFAKSKRQIDKYQAKKLIELLRQDIEPVGVFMNQDIDYVNEVIAYCNLDYVQLHGSESPEYCDLINGAEVIKTIGVESAESIEKADVYKDKYTVLLDTKTGNQSGGTGKRFDWTILNNGNFPKGYFLAGGITPENVRNAVKYKPDVLDVNSGVETNLMKDKDKIARLFRNLEV